MPADLKSAECEFESHSEYQFSRKSYRRDVIDARTDFERCRRLPVEPEIYFMVYKHR